MNRFQVPKTASLLFVIASAVAAQTPVKDVENAAHFPFQTAIPFASYQAGLVSASVNFDLNPAGKRYVIEHVSARCQFAVKTDDRAGEMIINTLDGNGNVHQYNLVVIQASTETAAPFNANISYVSEAMRTYHDGGANGAVPVQILFRFSNSGLKGPAFCQAEVSGYTITKQVNP
jgi:hypothetical protein